MSKISIKDKKIIEAKKRLDKRVFAEQDMLEYYEFIYNEFIEVEKSVSRIK